MAVTSHGRPQARRAAARRANRANNALEIASLSSKSQVFVLSGARTWDWSCGLTQCQFGTCFSRQSRHSARPSSRGREAKVESLFASTAHFRRYLGVVSCAARGSCEQLFVRG
jgi:hypothetical protein